MNENELQQVIEVGEGYKIEFKESLANLDKELVAEAGLSPVEFEFDTFFTVIFKRKAISKFEVFTENFGVNLGVKGKRLDRMVKILKTLYEGELLIDTQVAEWSSVTERTIENDIEFVRKNNLIKFVGAPKTGRYVLTEKGKRIIEEIGAQ